MPRTSSRDRLVRDVADTQLGLITAAQLTEIGVHSATTSRRALGGMWTRVLPGVHLVDGGNPSRRQRELAALLYAGSPAALTGLTALRRRGVRALRLQEVSDDEPERPEPIHVLVPHSRRRLSTGFVRVERTHRFPADVQTSGGLVLVSVDRAVADAARRLRRPADVSALVAEVVHRELTDIDALRRELDEGSRRGSALLRDALGPVEDGARSGPESDLVRILRAADIPAVHLNATILDGSGRFVAVPDVWLDDVAVAVEVDSIEHHAGPDGFASTVRRNARYAAAGVTVLSVLPSELRDHAGRVLHELLAIRAAAAERPRPSVRLSAEKDRSSGREGWRWGA